MCVGTNHKKNNFFLWKDKDKNMACAGTNHKNKGQDVEMNIVAQSLKKGVVQITTSHVNKSRKQTYLVLTRCNQYCLDYWKTKNKQKKYTKKKAKGL